MVTVRVVRTSLRTMGRYKLRSFFMMLGVLIGITALTLVVSIGKGAQRKIMAQVEQLFSASSLVVMSGGGRTEGGPHAGGARLTLEDIEAVADEVPNIENWDPVQMIPAREVRHQDRNATLAIWAYSERSETVWNRSVSRGEYFDRAAVERSSRVALIGEVAAAELFGDEDPIGAQIQIGSVPFRIIGVLEPMGTDLHGMDRDNELAVPITTAMRRLMNVDTIMVAKLIVEDPDRMDQTVAGIGEVLRERHGLSEGVPDDFRVMTPVAIRKMVGQATRVFSVFLPLIAAVSLLVGGVVAATLMLVSVNERVAEIGLRRAVGARPQDIRGQFVLETAAITLAGGLGGILLGLVGAVAVARVLGLASAVSWQAIVLGLVLSAATGLLAGVLPARRAAALEPVDALR